MLWWVPPCPLALMLRVERSKTIQAKKALVERAQLRSTCILGTKKITPPFARNFQLIFATVDLNSNPDLQAVKSTSHLRWLTKSFVAVCAALQLVRDARFCAASRGWNKRKKRQVPPAVRVIQSAHGCVTTSEVELYSSGNRESVQRLWLAKLTHWEPTVQVWGGTWELIKRCSAKGARLLLLSDATTLHSLTHTHTHLSLRMWGCWGCQYCCWMTPCSSPFPFPSTHWLYTAIIAILLLSGQIKSCTVWPVHWSRNYCWRAGKRKRSVGEGAWGGEGGGGSSLGWERTRW